MKKIVLAGNGTAAKIIGAYLRQDPRYSVIAATVDDTFANSSDLVDIPTIGISRLLDKVRPDDANVIMAIGYNNLNQTRASLYARLKSMGFQIETYVHPDSRVYTDLDLGDGSVILPGAIIEPGVELGCNTVLWCNAVLAHQSQVGNHCWIASGAVVSGQSRVESNSFLGVNSTIVNRVVVGERCFVGAGALVSRDTKPNTVHLARSAEEWRFSAEDYVRHFGTEE